MGLIKFLLKVWEPAGAARCTACGERAVGKLISNGSKAIICERCGERWNITVDWDDDVDPYDTDKI
jgi:hypothetical protein